MDTHIELSPALPKGIMDSEAQTRIISDLLRKADSTDTWQFSLHLAAKVSQGNVSDFAENPLSFSHVFVDFYIWLDSFLSSSHHSDADVRTIIDWISQASFGYDLEEESAWYGTSMKWVNTWRYLLFDLLSRVNPSIAELRDQIKEEDRFDEKSPLEDKERYYTVRDVPHEEYFAINDTDESISFKIQLFDTMEYVGRISNEINIIEEDNCYYAIVDKIKFYNDKYDTDMDSRTKLPFQISYAMSIHKAQGLEFDSVKIVITKEADELITKNVFYTAVTRAKKNLKIYWEPEVANYVLDNIENSIYSKGADLAILKQVIKNI